MKTKNISKISLLLIILFTSINCNKFDPEDYPLSTNINSFIWKAMNNYYLWQNEVPVLSDNKFKTNEELYEFVDNYNEPEDFFESLIYQRDVIDKWSWFVEDYVAQEAYFSGVRKSSGAKIKLHRMNEGSDDVFGIVRYIVPNTSASNTALKRGDVFNFVNGTKLNTNNYIDLLFNSTSFTLNLGTLHQDPDTGVVSITPNGVNISLSNEEYSENPVFIKKVFTEEGHKIGYIMYNSFTSNFDSDLNDAFQYLKNEGVTDLILDLRYNGGGSVKTAIYLCSMITGQFNDQILTQEEWNPKVQEWINENHPDWLENHFTNKMDDGTNISSLQLEQVIILTTQYSASASELVINALKPYIDVVTVGTTTHGKYVASVTLYDSEDFSKDNVNPDHLNAIQPIVLREVNKLGEYAINGFEPSVFKEENYYNLGVLGEENEPLTARAVAYILTGSKTPDFTKKAFHRPTTKVLTPDIPYENQMYIETTRNIKSILERE